MTPRSITAIAAAALFAVCVRAADPPAANALNWISGHWCSGQGAESVEEYWLPARGGMLVGLSRTIRGERVVNFEFMRIATADGALAFIAQPNGGVPVTFKLTSSGSDWARFENPQHDFPQRVEYRREGDRLRAHIAGPGKEGKEQVFPFEYQRCPGNTS